MDEILDAQYPCKHQHSCRPTYYDETSIDVMINLKKNWHIVFILAYSPQTHEMLKY